MKSCAYLHARNKRISTAKLGPLPSARPRLPHPSRPRRRRPTPMAVDYPPLDVRMDVDEPQYHWWVDPEPMDWETNFCLPEHWRGVSSPSPMSVPVDVPPTPSPYPISVNVDFTPAPPMPPRLVRSHHSSCSSLRTSL